MSNLQHLKEYVRGRVETIIKDKEESGLRPLLATDFEISVCLREDVLECMRELAREGSFRATRTLNNAALEKGGEQ